MQWWCCVLRCFIHCWLPPEGSTHAMARARLRALPMLDLVRACVPLSLLLLLLSLETHTAWRHTQATSRGACVDRRLMSIHAACGTTTNARSCSPGGAHVHQTMHPSQVAHEPSPRQEPGVTPAGAVVMRMRMHRNRPPCAALLLPLDAAAQIRQLCVPQQQYASCRSATHALTTTLPAAPPPPPPLSSCCLLLLPNTGHHQESSFRVQVCNSTSGASPQPPRSA